MSWLKDGVAQELGATVDVSGNVEYVAAYARSEDKYEVTVTGGTGSGEFFYFVHGYRAKALTAADVAATATYGETFTAAVERDNVMGTQFHPEKSGAAGLQILNNFLKL